MNKWVVSLIVASLPSLQTTDGEQIQTGNGETTNVLVVVNVVSNTIEVVNVPFVIGGAANYLQMAYETNRSRQLYELPVQWLSETNAARRQRLQNVVEASMRYWFLGRILNRESIEVRRDPSWHTTPELERCRFLHTKDVSSLFMMHGLWDVGIDGKADTSYVPHAREERHGLWNPQAVSLVEQYPDRCIFVGECIFGPHWSEAIVVFRDRETRDEFLEVDNRRGTEGPKGWWAWNWSGFTRVGDIVDQLAGQTEWKILAVTNENWKSGVTSIAVPTRTRTGTVTNIEVKVVVQCLR